MTGISILPNKVPHNLLGLYFQICWLITDSTITAAVHKSNMKIQVKTQSDVCVDLDVDPTATVKTLKAKVTLKWTSVIFNHIK